MEVFSPSYKSGQTIAVTTTTANSAIGKDSNSIVVTNTGTEVVYVVIGDSTVEATTAGYPVLGGTQVPLRKQREQTHIAVITGTGTSDLHCIPGEGI